ncbi:MAG: PHP domain-containing protein, partial [Miltoncostaeaceae bacterium]
MADPAGTADLHSHSTASDGALGPEDVVALAAERGVGTLALTDHDTLAGLPAAAAAAAAHGVRLVFGVELSVRVPHGSMHLVGYFEEMAPPALMGWLEELRAGRVSRAERIVGRLGDLGVGVEMADVLARAGGPVGRPHIADAMVAAGHARDRQDAFERYLGDGRQAWVPTQGLGPTESIALVAEAGGA